MNYDLSHGSRATAAAPEGRVWKWLSGGAVASLLWSGVFYAWITLEAGQPNTVIAYTAPSFAQTLSAPIHTDLAILSQTFAHGANLDAGPEHAGVARARHAHRAIDPLPAETARTIAVSASSQESAGIVVHGVREPVWTRTPSAWSLTSAYPQRALESGREGEASVHCTVRNSGALNCVRTSETPAFAGFGEAALRVARLFRHTPRRLNGSTAAGSAFDMRIVFRMADTVRRG